MTPPIARRATLVGLVLAVLLPGACASAPRRVRSATSARVPVRVQHDDSPDRLGSAAREALEFLTSTAVFESRSVGLHVRVSRGASAFGTVLADADAAMAFRLLFRRGTTAGRLYAIAGFFFVAPDQLEPAVRRMLAEGAQC